jgi:phosphoribosylglycinamide formyltransferase-1
VLVSGRGSNLAAILDEIRRGRLRAEVAVVISDKPDAPALQLARARGCATLTLDPKSYPTREQFDGAVAGALKQHGVELVVLAGYLRIITSALIEPFRHRIMNIHPALLPSFPGLKAQWQAVEAGVKLAGCTVHFVTEEVDRGPIVIQAAVPVRPGEREASLARRVLRQEHRIVPRAIELYAQGRVRVEGRTVTIKGLRAPKDTALINPPLTG